MEKNLAEKILKILTSRHFHQRGAGRNPPKPGDKNYNYFLERIMDWISKGEPIPFILGYGYHKNLRVCNGPEPDKAEKRSFEFLVRLGKMVQNIYPPGIIINVITSGKRAEFANGADPLMTMIYHEKLKEMILSNPDFSRYFRIFRLEEVWNRVDGFYSYLIRETEEVRATISEDPNLEELLIQAKRNILATGRIEESHITREMLIESVIRFKASFLTEKELQLYEKVFPGALILSYRPNPWYGRPSLLMWSIKEGNITQPWQGCYDEKIDEIITPERQKIIRPGLK